MKNNINKIIWKDVDNYEGVYEISNTAIIRRKDNHQIKKQHIDNVGYYAVSLWKDGVGQTVRVHRILAKAFIPNPHNFPQINHKDEDKTNNCVNNLEWCTQKYNNSYGTKTKKQLQTYKERNTSNAEKEVIMLSLDGDVINVYKSLSEASRQTGLSLGNLSEVCNKKPHRLTLGGYKWKFKE